MLLTVIVVSAQAPVYPRKETLPGDQLAARTERDDGCPEPSVVPDGLRMIALSADDVWNVAVSALD